MNSPILSDHFNNCRGNDCDVTKQAIGENGSEVQVLYAVDVTLRSCGTEMTTVLCEDCLANFVRGHAGEIRNLRTVCRVNVSRYRRAIARRTRFTAEGGIRNGTD